MQATFVASHTTPLCFMPDGRLVCYHLGDIIIIEEGKVSCNYHMFHNTAELVIGRCKILSRFLRLGIRSALAIDNDSLVVSSGNFIFEYNLKTQSLSKGYLCDKGVRPLVFTSLADLKGFDNGIYFGGYIHNFDKEPVSVYHRVGTDEWDVVYTFPKGEINHVHNIVADYYRQCLWILTGDFDDSAAIWKVSEGFKKVERFVSGDQKWRGCVAFAVPEGLLYSTDAPFDKNHVYLLKEDGTSAIVGDLSGSCIYGCQWKDKYVFSTVVEPDGRHETLWKLMFGWERGSGIDDNFARIYMGDSTEGFKEIYKEKKDYYPFIFQFGAFRFPCGLNDTERLYFQPIATVSNDMDLMGIQIN